MGSVGTRAGDVISTDADSLAAEIDSVTESEDAA
jgi:hypothetical protein